jgi:DNA replication and repair protein RecF
MDRAISATNVVYLKSLRRYHRVLLQRNLLLKSQENRSSNLYQSYTEQLCKYGILIMRERLQWIKRLNAVLPKILKSFAPEQSPIDLEYESGCLSYARESTQAFLVKNKELDSNTLGTLGPLSDSEQLPSLELLEQLFLARVSSLEVAEWKTGCSLVGPHRDDWVFYLDSHKLKGHASQGEVRSALLALKLAEVKLFQNETGYSPIFLLDDFSSELDGERRSFLMQFLVQTGLQTFITSTEDAFAVGKRYWMSSGVIEEGSHDN